MLVGLADMPVKTHAPVDTEFGRALTKTGRPPAVAHHVQRHVRMGGREPGHHLERVFDLLVRHQTREHHQPARIRFDIDVR